MMTETELLTYIEEFCGKYNFRVTDFSMRVLGNPNFVSDLRRGGGYSPRIKTVHKVLNWMKHYENKMEKRND